MPSVLITGASRGIGRAIAQRLAGANWTVHAGVRSLADGEELSAATAGDVRPVIVDVTDENQVGALGAAVGPRLDALVNNAGIVIAGPVEALQPDDLRRQLDVNVVGQVAVTQSVLPAIRTAGGRILFSSSISGRVSFPFMGAYTASKHALEATADALRVELRPWGIDVVLIEPGAIDTSIWQDVGETVEQVENTMSDEHRSLYAPQTGRMRKIAQLIRGRTTSPERVAEVVERALTADRPRARYLVGPDARAQLAMNALLPTRAQDWLTGKVSGAR